MDIKVKQFMTIEGIDYRFCVVLSSGPTQCWSQSVNERYSRGRTV